MKKEKKITIKFFLNKNLQSRYYYQEGSRKPQLTYPLYVQLTYNRKNTQFKSFYGGYYTDLSKVDQENIGGEGLLKFEEKNIRKTVEFELKRLGDRFDLKGLSDRYEKYCKAIELVLNEYLKGKLHMILIKTKPYEFANIFNYSDSKVDALILYKAVLKVYSGFEKTLPTELKQGLKAYEDFTRLYFDTRFYYNDMITVVDWLDGTVRSDFEEKLKKLYKNNRHKITDSIKIIDKIIESKTQA